MIQPLQVRFSEVYLSKRTAVPITVAVNLIIIPEESKNGIDKPISKVRVFSGFGSLAGDNVASSKPSRHSRICIR